MDRLPLQCSKKKDQNIQKMRKERKNGKRIRTSTSSTILERYGESGQPYLVPNFRGITLSFSPFSLMLAVGLLYIVFIMFRVPSSDFKFRRAWGDVGDLPKPELLLGLSHEKIVRRIKVFLTTLHSFVRRVWVKGYLLENRKLITGYTTNENDMSCPTTINYSQSFKKEATKMAEVEQKKQTFHKFTYCGVDVDQMLDMSYEQLMQLYSA
ncbi:40S ribosomal protein S15-like protein [Cricetulus griseus]|nr:40S ribosomal protein S15-like protein [Cricetulus griseus]